MNEKLISWIKNYVNMMMSSLENHYYHQYEHALEVANRAKELWEKEWLDEDNLEILMIAWLFHDIWFVIQYDNNEYIWATLAKNYLKSVLYPIEKIELVKKLIIATSYKKEPENLLESIIKDADTDNLWRDDFFEKWERIKLELEIIKKIKILDKDWIHYLIKLLYEHKFLTKSEIKERQIKKEENLKKLQEKIN